MNFKPKRVTERIEPIKTDPQKAVYYAIYNIGGRWPEAEPYIKNGDIRSWVDYKKHFNIKD